MNTSKTDSDRAECELHSQMDYSSMSLVELKKAAKVHVPPIKYYYVKSRKELVELLSSKELPQEMVREKLTINDLRQMAIAQNIPNVWKLRRSGLVAALYPSPHQNNKNNDHADKHDDPQACEGKQVGIQVSNNL